MLTGILCVPFWGFTQAKPFIGYDKVAWGASIDDVRKAYGIGTEVQAETSEEDENIVTLHQGGSPVRQFLFNQGKLYRVWVLYGDEEGEMTDKNLSELSLQLKNALTQRYGPQTDSKERNWSHSQNFMNLGPAIIRYTKRTTTYGKFAPDIEVTMAYTTGEGTFPPMPAFIPPPAKYMYAIAVCYTWKKFRDAYEASKLKL